MYMIIFLIGLGTGIVIVSLVSINVQDELQDVSLERDYYKHECKKYEQKKRKSIDVFNPERRDI